MLFQVILLNHFDKFYSDVSLIIFFLSLHGYFKSTGQRTEKLRLICYFKNKPKTTKMLCYILNNLFFFALTVCLYFQNIFLPESTCSDVCLRPWTFCANDGYWPSSIVPWGKLRNDNGRSRCADALLLITFWGSFKKFVWVLRESF